MPKTPSQTRAAALVPEIPGRRRRPPVVGSLGRPLAEADALAALVGELGALIDAAQQEVAMVANAALVTLHWQLGQRLRREILGQRRARYGSGIVVAVGKHLEIRYGRGFSEPSLRHMIRLAEVFPDPEGVAAWRRPLAWEHFKDLLLVADPLQRSYDSSIERELTPKLVLQDPHLQDFLGLAGSARDEDLETAIASEVERALLAVGFSLVERKKHIERDHLVDLLFFHRKMRRLVAIVLELGRDEIEGGAANRLEHCLRWLDRHERQHAEQAPLGILLRAGKQQPPSVRYVGLAEALPDLPLPLLEDCVRRALDTVRRRGGSNPNAASDRLDLAMNES